MHNLSDPINLRNQLNKTLEAMLDTSQADNKLQVLKQLSADTVFMAERVATFTVKYQGYVDQYQSIVDEYNQLLADTNLAIEEIGQNIVNSTPLLSCKELNKLMSCKCDDQLVPTGAVNRIYHYTNVMYPGLIVSPTSFDYVNLMVASDPLYLLGSSISALQPIIKNYPEQYQNRLRLYDNIERLPKNQFSLIFVTYFFRLVPYVQLIEYLKIMLELLRPGGCIVFTYYNCDIYEVAQLFEKGYIQYSSQTRLYQDCQQLGYEILEFNNDSVDPVVEKYVSWAQLKKPGELATIKRAQALGKILRK
jgi:SAM-dependent methyltransferase